MSNNTILNINQFSQTEHRTLPDGYHFKVYNSIIDFDLEFNSSKLRFVEFVNCTFNKKVEFKNLTVSKSFDFRECTFKDDVIFKNLVIEGKSRFWFSSFNARTEFDNVSFKDLADFFKVTFEPIIIFYKVDFFSTTVFTETVFRKNVLFTYTKIADVIIFIRTFFGGGIDLSQSIITGQVNIHNSDLLHFEDVQDIIDNDSYRDAIEQRGVITLNNQRETYRILKKFAKEDYNQFKYLEYSKLENEVYFKQLEPHKWKRFNNYIIFLANKYSNDHNMSWVIGVLFTASVAFVSFFAAILSTENVYFSPFMPSQSEFSSFVGLYFQFLSPLHEFKMFESESPGTWTIIFDFFGRILIGFGIYQTVQAFRKHKG